jgi:hypothetical protein
MKDWAESKKGKKDAKTVHKGKVKIQGKKEIPGVKIRVINKNKESEANHRIVKTIGMSKEPEFNQNTDKIRKETTMTDNIDD